MSTRRAILRNLGGLGLGRPILGGIAAASLAGCGFHPLYLPASSGGGPVPAELAAIYVTIEAERAGQLLRQALQRRLEGPGLGVAKRYELAAAPAISAEGLGIQTDTSTTRIRLNATATWYLRALDPQRTLLATGSARVLDGYNILNQQYFAADLENEAAIKRIDESLADQIVQQVAIFLRRRAAPTPAK